MVVITRSHIPKTELPHFFGFNTASSRVLLRSNILGSSLEDITQQICGRKRKRMRKENATCHAVTPPVTNRVTWPFKLALLKFDSMRDEMDFVCDANKTLVIRTDLPLSVLLLRSR
jgi:hypothetical protein